MTASEQLVVPAMRLSPRCGSTFLHALLVARSARSSVTAIKVLTAIITMPAGAQPTHVPVMHAAAQRTDTVSQFRRPIPGPMATAARVGDSLYTHPPVAFKMAGRQFAPIPDRPVAKRHTLIGGVAGAVLGAAATAILLYRGGSTSLCNRGMNQDAMAPRECAGLVAAGGLLGGGFGMVVVRW